MSRVFSAHFLAGLLVLTYSTAGCGQVEEPIALAEVDLSEVLSVGVIDGDQLRVFGRIIDVRATPDGSFVMLDQQAPAVRWFDLSGHHLGSLDGRGGGPGELSEPRAMAVSANGTVAIVDPRNARYSFFRLNREGISFEESVHTLSGSAASGRNICMVGDRIFLRFLRDGMLVHEIDMNGTILNSFERADSVSSDLYGSATPMVASQRNSGHLLCLSDPGMVISVARYSDNVRAFTLGGDEVWRTRISGMRPLQFAPAPSGGVVFKSHPEGSHLAESVVRWSPGTVVVQYSVTWPEGIPFSEREGDFFALMSRELSLDDGREVGGSDSLPLVFDVQDRFVYSASNLPFPQVRVFRRTRQN